MIVTSTTVPTVTCDGNRSGPIATQTVPDVEASITALSLFAPMIQINWQSSDRTEDATASQTGNPTRTGNRPAVTSGTQTVDPDAASGVKTLETDSARPAPTEPTTDDSSGETGGASDDAERKEASSEGSGGLSMATKVGLSIGGAAAVVALVVGVVIYVWRRRKHQAEEEELDRLYGMKSANYSSGDLSRGDDSIPGWYRGQRQVPTRLAPTTDPYRGGGGTELEAPASPYYQPYRP